MITNKLKFSFAMICFSAVLGCTEAGPRPILNQADDSRIIGGTKVQRAENETHSEVMLLNLQSNDVCSATIIGKKVLLTAAHCVPEEAKDLLAFYDSNPLAEDSQSEGQQVEFVEIHPDYVASPSVDSTDLALVFMKRKVPRNFESVELYDSVVDIDQLVQIAGYGKTTDEDVAEFGLLFRAEASVHVSSKYFFSVDQTIGVGICDGDSGGPAFIVKDGKQYLAGVAKMVYSENEETPGNCARTGQFTSVTSVDLREWINKTIQAKLTE